MRRDSTARAGRANEALEGRAPEAYEVTIKGDVAYLPVPTAGSGRWCAAPATQWKLDFTADPELRWVARARASPAGAGRRRGRRSRCPSASRDGIIAHLHAEAAAIATSSAS